MRTVVVQAGHLAPREPFLEGGTGTVGEIELVHRIRDKLVTLLARDGRFKALAFPGDLPEPPGVKCDAALFLHADGSGDPRTRGVGFGYPEFAVNKKLADLVLSEFRKVGHPSASIVRRNFTVDLREHYGYRRVDTAGPEVLVEHGFMTNPAEREWLENHVGKLALAEYRAICRFFSLAPRDSDTRPVWIVTATFKDGRTETKRTRTPLITAKVYRVKSAIKSILLEKRSS